MKLTMVIESTQDPHVHSAPDSAADQHAARRDPGAALCGSVCCRRCSNATASPSASMRERAECGRGPSTSTSPAQPSRGTTSSSRTTCSGCIYSIGLCKSSFRTKVSVGSNPWTKADPANMVNLATICERYGGGGHARVGAISFEPDKLEEARSAARDIVAELRSSVVRGQDPKDNHAPEVWFVLPNPRLNPEICKVRLQLESK